MRLDFEGQEDYYTFVPASELRELVARIGLHGEYRSFSGKWYGKHNVTSALRALTFGDESLVAASDSLLSKLEDKLPPTPKWQKVNHVAGPRVRMGAFLAGQPNSMRRRKKLDRDDAPVTIFMDLTSSAMIDAGKLLARGTAILALARALCEHRTVELWGGIAIGESGWRWDKAWSSTVAWRIDTTPLDLARAAFLLSAPAMARGIGYGIGPGCAGRTNWSGQWAFGNHDLHVRTQREKTDRRHGGERTAAHSPDLRDGPPR